tara:strand:+ start:168 stop:350 length:183 start_codon:yes stop_codon:yes gene_type:complete
MITDHIHTTVEIQCDNCLDCEECTDTHELFGEYLEEQGWKEKIINGEYIVYCPDCVKKEL